VKVAVLVVVSLALGAGCSRQEQTATEAEQAQVEVPVVDARPGELDLYISAAYADSLSDLIELFRERRPNVTFHKRTGDARSLVTEIREGARPDVFISPGDVEVKPLEQADLIGLRADVCFTTLGIITPKGNPAGVHGLEDLAADRTKAVAIGPADTSIGRYAVELLTDEGLWEKMEGKVAFAEAPSGVLELAAQGKADACLAYGAPLRGQANEDNTELRAKLKLVGDLTAQYCLKIPCPAISPVGCRRPELAEEFIDFLTGDGAQEVLARHGFLRLNDPCCAD
jgi:molybdate transport system substrate-binding protein